MTIRPIVRFPDARLKLVAETVETFDGELRQLATDLLDTMRAAPGIGITAPHIGVAKRVVVLQLTDVEEALTYVNPIITWASDEKMRHAEGSVSMPGVREEIERSRTVHVTYRVSMAKNASRKRRACGPSATSMRSTSSTASSGSSGSRR